MSVCLSVYVCECVCLCVCVYKCENVYVCACVCLCVCVTELCCVCVLLCTVLFDSLTHSLTQSLARLLAHSLARFGSESNFFAGAIYKVFHDSTHTHTHTQKTPLFTTTLYFSSDSPKSVYADTLTCSTLKRPACPQLSRLFANKTSGVGVAPKQTRSSEKKPIHFPKFPPPPLAR